jgi:hypothetical protein
VYREFKDVGEFLGVLEEFVKGRGATPKPPPAKS